MEIIDEILRLELGHMYEFESENIIYGLRGTLQKIEPIEEFLIFLSKELAMGISYGSCPRSMGILLTEEFLDKYADVLLETYRVEMEEVHSNL